MLRTRILAAATATLLALGMAAGGASPAIASDHSAAGTPCDSIGYEKPDSLNDLPDDAEGSASFDWGTITWDSPEVEVTVNEGYVVGICVKGGNTYPTESGPLFSDDNVVDGTEIDWTYSHGFGLSHLGYKLYSAASASIAFNDATCTSSQTLNVAGFVATNATFGDPVYDGANFTVVATANSGAFFPDGDDVSLDNTTKTFTGTLSPPNPELCPVATASIDFTAPTCTTGEQLNEGGFMVSNAELTSSEVVDGTYTVVFTATGDALFAAGEGVSEDRTMLTFTGTLDPADLSLCPVATASIDFTAPTCTTGEQLNEDGFMVSNAELTSSEVVDGTYTVVFTATGDALFAAGEGVSEDRTMLTFTGTLDPADLSLCPVATASIDFTAPTCTTGEQLNEDGFMVSNAELTSSEVVDGTYTVVFTATGDALFAAGEGVSEDRTMLTFTGTLDPKNEQLCVVVEASFTLPPATCELGEDWENPIIDADAGVTAGEPVFDAETQTVSITFLATGANVFVVEVEGEMTFVKTLTVTLDVAGPDAELCLEAIAAIAVNDADCFFDSTLDEEGFTAENADYEITIYNAETREYEVVFTADYGYRFDTSLDGVSEDGMTRTFSGTLEAADPDGDGCVLPITDASIAFIDATCLDPQMLDEEGFEFDSELAELESVTYDGLDYTVVFVTIGEDTQFFQSDEPMEGRTVSEDGKTLTFTGTLAGPNEELCPEVIVPPIVVVDDCFEQSYTITDVEGVTYTRTVNGLELPVSFGEGDSVTYEAAPFDTITVTATPDEGYLLAEGYEAFEYTYAFDEDCLPTAPVTTASVTWTQADCLGNPGSYTLTNEPGVIWTVDGVVVAGNTKYTAAIGSTPSIVASLEPASEEFPTGFGWSDEDQRTLWNLVFAAADDCLPTLALTGASNALGGLGVIAILIMMAGTGLVVARRREAVRIQG